MSTPRRELTAAVISVNVPSMLSRELKYEDPVQVFYTDSSVVLGYIRNEAKRFHTYVGNRVHHIRGRSEPQQWHYVASMVSPADVASRGTTPKQLSEHESWFKGPSFVWENNVTIRNSNPQPNLESGKKRLLPLSQTKFLPKRKSGTPFQKSLNRNVSTTHHR